LRTGRKWSERKLPPETGTAKKKKQAKRSQVNKVSDNKGQKEHIKKKKVAMTPGSIIELLTDDEEKDGVSSSSKPDYYPDENSGTLSDCDKFPNVQSFFNHTFECSNEEVVDSCRFIADTLSRQDLSTVLITLIFSHQCHDGIGRFKTSPFPASVTRGVKIPDSRACYLYKGNLCNVSADQNIRT
jgi:hypothetical protein